MLLSIVLELSPSTDASLPANVGRANFAETLRRLREIQPGSDEAIHGWQGLRPITCSDLHGVRIAKGRKYVREGERCWVHLTSMDRIVSDWLWQAFVQKKPERWSLDGVEFEVINGWTDPADHPWSGVISYQDLADQHLFSTQPIKERQKVRLQLASPTAFKSNEMQMPFPLPSLVFGSLVDRWNAFSPIELDARMRRFGAELIAVSRFNLKSELVKYKQGFLSGAVGEVTYITKVDDRYWLAMFQLLADFAVFSGAGVKTSAGMGEMRRL